MIQLQLKVKSYTKNYLRALDRLSFHNLMDLIWELFENHQIPKTDLDDLIYQLLENLGYQQFTDIPEAELKRIARFYYHPKNRPLANYDSEKETYLLMANILNENVITFIDQKVLKDTRAAIQLHEESVISFINQNKIQAIQFTTI